MNLWKQDHNRTPNPMQANPSRKAFWQSKLGNHPADEAIERFNALEGCYLKAVEDIVDPESHTLLMAKGQVVSAEILDKLIRFGVRPQQFVLFDPDDVSEDETTDQTDLMDTAQNHSPYQVAAVTPKSQPLHGMTFARNTNVSALTPASNSKHLNHPIPKTTSPREILIFSTQPMELKRMTHCLTTCGVNTAQIHPVSVFKTFGWAMQKYQPNAVFLELDTQAYQQLTQSSRDRALLIEALSSYLLARKPLILVSTEETALELADLLNSANLPTTHLYALPKPVNRFDLFTLFNSSADLQSILQVKATEEMMMETWIRQQRPETPMS